MIFRVGHPEDPEGWMLVEEVDEDLATSRWVTNYYALRSREISTGVEPFVSIWRRAPKEVTVEMLGKIVNLQPPGIV